MRFTHIDVNFDVKYEGQNWHQYVRTSLCQFNFFVNLLHRSYQYLQDATWISFLSDKSTEILGSKYSDFCNSPCWPPGQHGVFICKWGRSDVTRLICIWTRSYVLAMWPVWRIGKYLNFPPLISQGSYQISSQMRWHPLAPDKTFLKLKGFDKIPTDNREICYIQKWSLKHPADLLINIIVDNLWQRMPSKFLVKIHAALPTIQVTCMYK